ncbi:MAG: hypothetical protein ND866_30820 [Pyrinomonadaceae bacterium]|nr:hypothetical protein [Pyrinomonadaceae bacterium]
MITIIWSSKMLSGLRKFSLKILLRYVWGVADSVSVVEEVVTDTVWLGELTGVRGGFSLEPLANMNQIPTPNTASSTT